MSDVPVEDLPDNLVPANDLPDAEETSGIERFKAMSPVEKFNAIAHGWAMGQPQYWVVKGIEKTNEALEHGANALGGKVTDALAGTVSPEVAAGAGYLSNVGVQAIPVLLGNAVGKAAAPSVAGKAESLMQSALKPPKAALKSGDAAKAVRTLLDEGVNVSEGGVAKLTARIDELDDALDLAIKGSKGTLSNVSVLKPLKQVMDQYRAGTLAEENLPRIREVARKLLNHPSLRGSEEMTTQFAQAMKRQNYKELGDAYRTGASGPTIDSLKGVTRGLKEGLEGQLAMDAEYLGLPNAAKINAEMGPLINARDLALERALVAGNRDQFSLALLAKHPSAGLAMLADRSPVVKSILARMLWQASKGERLANTGAVAGGILAGNNEGILAP